MTGPEPPVADTAARRSALVVIDVQEQVMDGGWRADEVLSGIASLLAQAREAGVPVVYVQHESEEMLPGTPGWQIVSSIAPTEGEPIVHKKHQDAFADTVLKETLDGLGVGHLVIVGAQTDQCVISSSRRALIEGYDVTVVEDCHTTGDAIFDLTDGEKVEISAKQIVAHTNLALFCLSYPGVECAIAPRADIVFAS